MKNLIVYYDSNQLHSKFEDIPIPQPGPYDVLVKVEVAGSNVKDYKHPLPAMYNNALNQGDDCAGTVVKVGDSVRSFSKGERVAGFHVMDSPNGTYAEFAICPEHTVFRIPDTTSFEEAATIPLAAFTAAVALYRNLNLPTPWDRSDEHAPETTRIPLVINGASTAVGSFAIKLAKLNPRVGPIIATAGSSGDYVQSLRPDAVVDYRSSTVADDLKMALGGSKVAHVLDASNSLTSIQYLSTVMQKNSRYVCTSKLYVNSSLGVDESMENTLRAIPAWYELVFVGDVHGQPLRIGDQAYAVAAGGPLFGSLMSRVFEHCLADGTLTGHPYEKVKDGLHGVRAALIELKERKRRGNAKFVTRIADTKGL